MRVSIAFLALLSLSANAAILGEKDDRIEMYELPAEWMPMAQGTISLSSTNEVVQVRNQWKTFTGGQKLSTNPEFRPLIHPKHRFAEQGQVSDCSGFLVSPDVMVTASHCLPENGDHSKLNYVLAVAGLGYASEASMKASPLMIDLAEENISKIETKVLYAGTPSVNSASDSDFAILKLKKPIFHVKPLALKLAFAGDYKTPLAILGHGMGLALKADLHGEVAQVTAPEHKLMLAFLDASNGNSGGPVFDPTTKGVVGILVTGGKDWIECDPIAGLESAPQYFCEAFRPTTVEQLEADKNVPRKLIKSFWQKYPSGVVTAWANRVLRVDQIAQKLTELGIPYSTSK